MKNLNEMSVKELREIAKEKNIAGRWDMTKTQLIEAIEKVNEQKESDNHKLVPMPGTEDPDWGKKAAGAAETTKVEEKAEAKKEKVKKAAEKAMKVQRAFVEAGEARKEAYRYITVTIKNANESQAASYIESVCVKMTELDSEFHSTYKAMNTPDVHDGVYTDTISFEKAKGHIAIQRNYVGKLMTKAMAAIKLESK